jgi:hypothetical protein
MQRCGKGGEKAAGSLAAVAVTPFEVDRRCRVCCPPRADASAMRSELCSVPASRAPCGLPVGRGVRRGNAIARWKPGAPSAERRGAQSRDISACGVVSVEETHPGRGCGACISSASFPADPPELSDHPFLAWPSIHGELTRRNQAGPPPRCAGGKMGMGQVSASAVAQIRSGASAACAKQP